MPVAEFEAASCSRTFEKGEGLPGPVWATGKPALAARRGDRTRSFPGLASAAKYDLHSAFACPVVVGDRTLGVIEFFTKRIREPDADLLEMMGTVAGNFGQFLERKAAEEQVRQSERELADFFENATVGLHWVGADGIILRANRAELDTARLQPGGVRRSPHRRLPRRRGHDLRHPEPLAGRGGTARVPGPAQVQGRVDQGRADRLQRDVPGRRVRPHPLLHQGRDREQAGGSRTAGGAAPLRGGVQPAVSVHGDPGPGRQRAGGERDVLQRHRRPA